MTQIDIAGTTFTADWASKTLTENGNPANTLKLDPDQLSGDNSHYLLLYDSESHQEILLDESVTQLPETTLFLEIPNRLHAKQLTAETTSWRDTNLPAVLAQNRNRMDGGYWEQDEETGRQSRGR